MLVSRVVSLLLRLAQFVSSAIVLGIVAYFLYQRDHYGVGPLARTIYTEVVAALSVIFSLIWMIPTTSSIIGYSSDLFFTAAWFAAFGVLVNWYNSINCGSIWNWGGITLRGDYCGKWNAAQAFSFLAAIFWFASFILGLITYHRLSTQVTTDGSQGRRRWRRSRV